MFLSKAKTICEDHFNCKWGSIAHGVSLSSTHCPDITEILLKSYVKSQVCIQPCLPWNKAETGYYIFEGITGIKVALNYLI